MIAVAFRAIQGDFIISGADATTVVSIDAFAGKLRVDNTCFGPNIRVYDTVDITDQSTDGLQDVRDLPTADQIYAEFTSGTNADAFKADVSLLATSAEIAALNDFDPVNDVVANVTLVDTVTTNTDMRGTDNANTVVPDNAGITQIQSDIAALNDLSAAQVKAQIDQALLDYDGPTKAELDAAQASIEALINGLNNPSGTDVAQAVWQYLQSETTISNSMKEAIEQTLINARLIPAGL